MLWIVVGVCSRMISERTSANAALLACPSSLPASSGSYSDCTFSDRTSREFDVTSELTLTLRFCVFTNCSGEGHGGCIYCTGTVNVYSCSFTACKNTGSECNGGAICIGDASSSALIEDSQFSECSTSFDGGAISFRYVAQCTIRNCQFTDCQCSTTVGTGGAIADSQSAGPGMTITSCSFVNCSEYWSGGSNEGGGAVKCCSGTTNITQCSFDSCFAGNTGAAICCFAFTTLSVFVSHCEIRKCSASRGGGGIACAKWNNYPSLSISYLTITDCTAASSLGQAIHIYSCNSFKWDHLCITGTGTLVKTDDSSSVPTEAELKECVTPLFTQQMQLYSIRRLCFMEVFMMYYILA